jgi:hypothetical protein
VFEITWKIINTEIDASLSRRGESIPNQNIENIHALFKTERNDDELGFKISNSGC